MREIRIVASDGRRSTRHLLIEDNEAVDHPQPHIVGAFLVSRGLLKPPLCYFLLLRNHLVQDTSCTNSSRIAAQEYGLERPEIGVTNHLLLRLQHGQILVLEGLGQARHELFRPSAAFLAHAEWIADRVPVMRCLVGFRGEDMCNKVRDAFAARISSCDGTGLEQHTSRGIPAYVDPTVHWCAQGDAALAIQELWQNIADCLPFRNDCIALLLHPRDGVRYGAAA